jgi:hypothetical protein
MKRMKKKIKFGYEIGTGKEVEIPMSHMVITGLTAESGKTTCVMGLIKRSGLKAVIIKTKIGEKAITEGTVIPPFYKENFDWEYASELLESSRKEKLKFERSWIIKYSRSATNLLEFKRNIDDALAEPKLRELEKSVLISLQAYLEKILPELQYAPLSSSLDLKDGINIMDLERFKEETQNIIIKSVLDEVLKKEKNVVIILPECWKYLPEKYASPVKRPAEAFVRQGATNNNFLFLDSQDITGISKTVLKQVSVWVLGYQREINEIRRTLDQIPLSKRNKPKPNDIATLKLGQFFVATSAFTKKAYAQPSWLDDKRAKNVSLGVLNVDAIEQPAHIAPYQVMASSEQPLSSDETYQPKLDLNKKINELRDDFISNRNDFFNKFQQVNETISKIFEELYKVRGDSARVNEDEIVMRVLQKIPVSSGVGVNKEEIISQVLARVPKFAGGAVYQVAPIEKIKKDFLKEAKEKILANISGLDDKQKRILKWIEQKGSNTKRNELYLNCFGKSATGGQEYKNLNNKVVALKNLELIREDTNSRIFPFLKDRINNLISQYGATKEEIEQVYNHIMMEVI